MVGLGALRAAARRRRWPLVATVCTVVAGMGYTLLFPDRVHGVSFWRTPGDIWSTLRGAHWVAWGGLGSVYGVGTGLVTFPGVLLLLAPVAALCSALGASESFPFPVPHPTAWLVLGPVEIVVSSVALFACDALAQRLGVGPGRRFSLCVAEAAALWNVDVVWGHPEDALALGLVLYGLCAALGGRWRAAGWLAGAAVAVQPLVLVALPIVGGLGGWRRLGGLALRATAPAAAVLATPLLAQPRATLHVLVDQPNFPNVDHVTPFTALAPRLGGHGMDVAVAAGPGRVVALALACLLGVVVWRRRPSPAGVVWAVALALSLRCVTESVMVPFYLWPGIAVGLLAAARRGPWRLAIAGVVGVAISTYGDFHLGPWWVWWSVVSLGLAGVLALGAPPIGRSRRAQHVPILSTIGEDRPPFLAGAVQ